MLIYLPVYNLIGENMIFSIGLMFVVYIIGQFISYKMLNARDYGFLNKLTIPLILLIYGIFIFYTYKPIHNYIFYDKVESKYGIDDYTKTISD